MHCTFELNKPAKRNGGDKYTYTQEDEEYTIYVPQSMSRANSTTPSKNLFITISNESFDTTSDSAKKLDSATEEKHIV
jgi:hypothetical protein